MQKRFANLPKIDIYITGYLMKKNEPDFSPVLAFDVFSFVTLKLHHFTINDWKNINISYVDVAQERNI